MHISFCSLLIKKISDDRHDLQSGCSMLCHGSGLSPSKRAWCWWLPGHISREGRALNGLLTLQSLILFTASCSQRNLWLKQPSILGEICWSTSRAMPQTGDKPSREEFHSRVMQRWACFTWMADLHPKFSRTGPGTSPGSCKRGLHVLLQDYWAALLLQDLSIWVSPQPDLSQAA